MPATKHAPRKDYLDKQLIHEYIDKVLTHTSIKAVTFGGVIPPLQKFTMLMFKILKPTANVEKITILEGKCGVKRQGGLSESNIVE